MFACKPFQIEIFLSVPSFELMATLLVLKKLGVKLYKLAATCMLVN